MNESLISVIIPTHKRNSSIVNRAVESVINQSHRNIEIIIVDDSPDDYEGRASVEKMIALLNDSRIKYIKHEKNMGACAARNTGIIESKGEYLAFLDDDDEWLEFKLEKQLAKMTDLDIGLVYCRQKIVDDTSNNATINTRKLYSGQVFDTLIVENFIGSTSFVLIRRNCFKECGLFDINIKSAQDYEMWLRITQKYKVDYVDEISAIYHVHDNERITSNPNNKIQGLELLNNYYCDYLNKHKKVKSIRIIKIIPYYLMTGDNKKAIKAYCQAVKLAPFNIKWNLKYFSYFLR